MLVTQAQEEQALALQPEEQVLAPQAQERQALMPEQKPKQRQEVQAP